MCCSCNDNAKPDASAIEAKLIVMIKRLCVCSSTDPEEPETSEANLIKPMSNDGSLYDL